MGGDAQRGRKRKRVVEETLVLDQCALFAMRQAISAAQGREVAHRHDARSREEGQAVITALDRGTVLPPITLGLMQKCSVELGTLIPVSFVLMGALCSTCTLMLYAQVSTWQKSTIYLSMGGLEMSSATRTALRSSWASSTTTGSRPYNQRVA